MKSEVSACRPVCMCLGRARTLFDFNEVNGDGGDLLALCNQHYKFVVHSLQFNQCTVGGNLGDDGLAQRVGNACVCVAEHEVAIVIVDESDLQNPRERASETASEIE